MKLKRVPKIITLVLCGIILLTFIDMIIATTTKTVPLFSIKKDGVYYSLYYRMYECNGTRKISTYFDKMNCEG